MMNKIRALEELTEYINNETKLTVSKKVKEPYSEIVLPYLYKDLSTIPLPNRAGWIQLVEAIPHSRTTYILKAKVKYR